MRQSWTKLVAQHSFMSSIAPGVQVRAVFSSLVNGTCKCTNCFVMADDPQRNFRSAYYEKVGFRGVEEKKSLEILLKDNPLGVLPPHSDSHSLVGGYRKEQYQDIVESLEVMRYINPCTPFIHIYLRMFQLESQVLPRCSETLPPNDENEDFLAIARAMEEIVDDPVDCYWLIKCFINQFHNKFGDSLPHLEEPRLLNHLRSIGALPQLPYSLWFKRCFAGCLPESSLQSYKIMLIGNTRPEGVVKFLCNIPQENTDAIVSKAIDLWQKYCGNPNHAV
ncbi:hypothetical protein GOODEAATRI_017282 [Goodea atripinnis]|uniref:Uncharacterized protein n=1 Tax=Goodea atripinnis TaxID=208336 RepID=A0ABV0N270_9TELE